VASRALVGDPRARRDERLAALGSLASGLPTGGPRTGETNNHIHTIYSFSPYTPSMAALRAAEAGLEAAGSVDHDSISASREMTAACKLLGLASVTGCEVRASFRTGLDGKRYSFADRKINNPDSAGIVYMTIQGVSADALGAVDSFLNPIRAARRARTARMAAIASLRLREVGIEGVDMERDIVAASKADEGGGITERHLLAAVASRLVEAYGRGQALVSGLLRDFGISPPARLAALLADPNNEHLVFDLLGVLKSGFLESIYEQPGPAECPDAAVVAAFARSIDAIPAYAYLGDVGDSPTGDKRAEKFEDDFLEELLDAVKAAGFLAVTYMPPRNTRAQLERVGRLCEERSLMRISGVDINGPRQSFNCPELRLPEFAALGDATWALAMHELLVSHDRGAGIFSPRGPLAGADLAARIAAYAAAGRSSLGVSSPARADPDRIIEELKKGRYTR